MNYGQAYRIFQTMPQSKRVEYVRLVKENKTNLIIFVEAYQREQEEKEFKAVVEESASLEASVNAEKLEAIQEISEELAELAEEEEWWQKIRSRIVHALEDEKTKMLVLIVLKDENSKVGRIIAVVMPHISKKPLDIAKILEGYNVEFVEEEN